jgi:hypothetical protein
LVFHKITPEIAKKTEYISRNVKLTPSGGGPRGTSLHQKIKISFTTQQIYSQKSQKTEYISPSPKLTSMVGGVTGPLGPKNKISFTTLKIYSQKVQKTEYIKLVIPVIIQDGPLHWLCDEARSGGSHGRNKKTIYRTKK